MGSRKDFVQRLMTALCDVDFNKPVAQRMTYRSLPWLTDATFLGYQVGDLMTPAVEGGGKELRSIFDTWCYPLVEGVDQRYALDEAGYPALQRFLVEHGASVAERAVLLLYALGRAANATLTYDETRVLVQCDGVEFGITAGVVTSRFCSGLDLGHINPVEILESTHDVRVFNATFIALYREAYGRDDGSLEALIALRTGDQTFDFKLALKRSAPPKIPQKREMNRFTEVALTGKDPVGKLYNQMVPKWMSPAEFSKVLGALATRNRDPTPEARLQLSNNIHHHFYKKKNKENQ